MIFKISIHANKISSINRGLLPEDNHFLPMNVYIKETDKCLK